MAWSPTFLCLAPGLLLVFIQLLVDFFLEKKNIGRTRPISFISHHWIILSLFFTFCVLLLGGWSTKWHFFRLFTYLLFFRLFTYLLFWPEHTNIFSCQFHSSFYFPRLVILFYFIFFLPQCHILLNSSCNGLWHFWGEAVTVDEFFFSSQLLTMTDVTSTRIVTAARPTQMTATGAMTIVSLWTTAAQKARSEAVSKGFQRIEKSWVGLDVYFRAYGIAQSYLWNLQCRFGFYYCSSFF